MPAASRSHTRAFLHRRAIGRLLTATVAGVLTGILVTGNHGWAFRLVTGWDVGLVVLLGLAWNIILRYGPEETRLRAARAAGLGLTPASFPITSLRCAGIFAACLSIILSRRTSDYPRTPKAAHPQLHHHPLLSIDLRQERGLKNQMTLEVPKLSLA